MGRWVHADAVPPGGITIEGDSEQKIFKDWTQRWRVRWRWAVISVDTTKPFHLYFESDGVQMRFTETLRCKWAALRIGPKAVRFATITVQDGLGVEVHRVVPDLWTKRELRRRPGIMTMQFAEELRWL